MILQANVPTENSVVKSLMGIEPGASLMRSQGLIHCATATFFENQFYYISNPLEPKNFYIGVKPKVAYTGLEPKIAS